MIHFVNVDSSFDPMDLQVLEGDRLVSTPYKLKFRTDVDNEVLCSKTLSTEELKKFGNAVNMDYYFQVRATQGLLACPWTRYMLSLMPC